MSTWKRSIGHFFWWGLILISVSACKGKQDNGGNQVLTLLKVPDTVCHNVVVAEQSVIVSDSETEKAMKERGLVDVTEVDSSIQVSLIYASADNFTGQVLYLDIRKAFLLPEVAHGLSEAQKRLKTENPGYSLIVYDAARPMSVQAKMWEKVKGTDQQVYVSNPAHGGGLHNYGAAVDIAIVDEQGRMLEMGSPVDYFGDEARPDKENALVEQGRITMEAWHNRRLLRKVMREAGFRSLHSEWWHFNWMSREEAKAKLTVIP